MGTLWPTALAASAPCTVCQDLGAPEWPLCWPHVAWLCILWLLCMLAVYVSAALSTELTSRGSHCCEYIAAGRPSMSRRMTALSLCGFALSVVHPDPFVHCMWMDCRLSLSPSHSSMLLPGIGLLH